MQASVIKKAILHSPNFSPGNVAHSFIQVKFWARVSTGFSGYLQLDTVTRGSSLISSNLVRFPDEAQTAVWFQQETTFCYTDSVRLVFTFTADQDAATGSLYTIELDEIFTGPVDSGIVIVAESLRLGF